MSQDEVFSLCQGAVSSFFKKHGIKVFLEKDRLFLSYNSTKIDFDSDSGKAIVDKIASAIGMDSHLVSESIIARDYDLPEIPF